MLLRADEEIIMKVHSYEITEKIISEVENKLRTKKSFRHVMLDQLLKERGIPHYDKISLRFISYDAASRIIVLWKKQKLIEKYVDNMGGYWMWLK